MKILMFTQGMFRMIALYFPKQLFRKENMIKNAEIVSEGVSYYYVDGQGKVYRHITDNKVSVLNVL